MTALNWPKERIQEMAKTIRRDVLVGIFKAASGHPGGPLSAADYLTALWFRHLRLDPENPKWENRDRFIMSNGHCSMLNYALLARRGFFDPSYLMTFRTKDSRLQGHPNATELEGLEVNTGSLGQGLSVGVGMALGARFSKLDDVRVFVNVGDGELQEGQMWEAAMSAGHYKLDNLIVTVDYNDAQIDGHVKNVMRIDPLSDKLRAFHWDVVWADGHNIDSILIAFQGAIEAKNGRPTAIIFKTLMMKGCPSYEDDPGWHGRPPKHDEVAIMLKELGFDETPQEALASYGEPRFK
ncbi:transketolase [bacterium]|nr:transketolase [bacterium]